MAESKLSLAFRTSGASAWSRLISSASRSLSVRFLMETQYTAARRQRHLSARALWLQPEVFRARIAFLVDDRIATGADERVASTGI
jgi:hypothetical protein